MSHGGADEPNLTPLLDVVLQLVMFFMLCANFVMEQVNESIKLPEAIAAKAIDKDAASYIILNVNERGETLIGNKNPEVLVNQVQVRSYLEQQAKLDDARAKSATGPAAKGGGRSVVILRADLKCNFKMVYDVMDSCRNRGFSNVQLRVTQVAGG